MIDPLRCHEMEADPGLYFDATVIPVLSKRGKGEAGKPQVIGLSSCGPHYL